MIVPVVAVVIVMVRMFVLVVPAVVTGFRLRGRKGQRYSHHQKSEEGLHSDLLGFRVRRVGRNP